MFGKLQHEHLKFICKQKYVSQSQTIITMNLSL